MSFKRQSVGGFVPSRWCLGCSKSSSSWGEDEEASAEDEAWKQISIPYFHFSSFFLILSLEVMSFLCHTLQSYVSCTMSNISGHTCQWIETFNTFSQNKSFLLRS